MKHHPTVQEADFAKVLVIVGWANPIIVEVSRSILAHGIAKIGLVRIPEAKFQ